MTYRESDTNIGMIIIMGILTAAFSVSVILTVRESMENQRALFDCRRSRTGAGAEYAGSRV
jgi:hypothetical protein